MGNLTHVSLMAEAYMITLLATGNCPCYLWHFSADLIWSWHVHFPRVSFLALVSLALFQVLSSWWLLAGTLILLHSDWPPRLSFEILGCLCGPTCLMEACKVNITWMTSRSVTSRSSIWTPPWIMTTITYESLNVVEQIPGKQLPAECK